MPGASLGVAIRMQEEGIDYKNPKKLMPTPTSRDHKDGTVPHERKGVVQTDTVTRAIFHSGEIALMYTPQVDDAKNTGHNQTRRPTLASEVWETERTTNWGKYEAAITRWENLTGMPVPSPVKNDAKDGSSRLSSEFTEWLMGFPAGWLTNSGMTRREELVACGNAVVPQQAEYALQQLLGEINESK